MSTLREQLDMVMACLKAQYEDDWAWEMTIDQAEDFDKGYEWLKANIDRITESENK